MAILQLILLIVIIYLLLTRSNNSGRKLNMPHSIKPSSKLILDSCALIDGRIVDLVRTGFVNQELVIPQFILNELQLLADGQDAHKRERARFGLDVASEL